MNIKSKVLCSILVFSVIFALFSTSYAASGDLVQSNIILVEQTPLLVSNIEEIPKTEPQPVSVSLSDRELLERLVQHEVGNCSLEHKRIIAQVVLNRVNSPKFKQNTIRDVIYAPGQFQNVSEITLPRWAPDAETKQAVEEVLSGSCEDKSQGALYFYNPRYTAKRTSNWFENDLQFLFELEGHRFFK